MTINFQHLFIFCGEEIIATVYIHQHAPIEGLMKRYDSDGYPVLYPTRHIILETFCKPCNNNDVNVMLYNTLLHHCHWFGCYTSWLIPKMQHNWKFNPRYGQCIMVRNMYGLPTLCRIWDLAVQVVKWQSDVIFDMGRNAPAWCQTSDQTDNLKQCEETEYTEEIDNGGRLLLLEHDETDGDQHLGDETGTSRKGTGHGSCQHYCSEDHTD